MSFWQPRKWLSGGFKLSLTPKSAEGREPGAHDEELKKETPEALMQSLQDQDPFVRATIELYARGHDLKDPLVSPVYGDMRGFPPAILTSGTRDLYLSNTVRVHRKLRAAGVEAVLQVWEGQSHAQYLVDVNAPETKENHADVARFFDHHLER